RSLRTCAPYRWHSPGAPEFHQPRRPDPRAAPPSHLADLLRAERLPQQVERLLLAGLAGGPVVDVVQRLVPRIEAEHRAAARRAVVLRVVGRFIRARAGPRVLRGPALATTLSRPSAGTPGLRPTSDRARLGAAVACRRRCPRRALAL